MRLWLESRRRVGGCMVPVRVSFMLFIYSLVLTVRWLPHCAPICICFYVGRLVAHVGLLRKVLLYRRVHP